MSLDKLIPGKWAMNIKSNQQQSQVFETFSSANSNNFNFEEWASEVKKQMIASLEKRTTKRQVRR